MNRLALLAALLVVSLAGPASAESYISLGIGDAATHGTLPAENLDGSSLKLALGQRFGKLALEASLLGTDFNSAAGTTVYGTTTATVGLKLHIPIAGPFEIYGKGGLNKTWDSNDLSGRGHELGLGLQWNLRLPVTSAALWLDYTSVSTTLRNDNGVIFDDGNIGAVMIGASLGF